MNLVCEMLDKTLRLVKINQGHSGFKFKLKFRWFFAMKNLASDRPFWAVCRRRCFLVFGIVKIKKRFSFQ